MPVSTVPLDPRAVCNLMLDEGERLGLELTHLALQKLLYFAHGTFLVEKGRPLVSGYFEAWKNGPVHPAVYKAFKVSGAKPINFRAHRHDALTGKVQPIALPAEPDVRRSVVGIVSKLGSLSAGRLVDISHARHAPWHFVVEEGRSAMALGLRITDAVILEKYKHHKISIGAVPSTGETYEDAPFA